MRGRSGRRGAKGKKRRKSEKSGKSGKSGEGRKGGKGRKSDPVARLKAGLVTRYERSSVDDLVRCPFCKAEISSTARKCRYCSEWVAGRCRQCGAGIRGRWAAHSLCANCEQAVPPANPPQVFQHITATGGLRSCARCGIQTMHFQQKPNHILHLLLTVFTVGIWLPVWALVGFLREKPQCGVCGRKPGLFGSR